jgi:hypothetical protein
MSESREGGGGLEGEGAGREGALQEGHAPGVRTPGGEASDGEGREDAAGASDARPVDARPVHGQAGGKPPLPLSARKPDPRGNSLSWVHTFRLSPLALVLILATLGGLWYLFETTDLWYRLFP